MPSSSEPITADVTVNNTYGLHLRCCNEIAKLASQYKSAIRLANGTRIADAKSMIGLTSLAAPRGTVLKLTAKGTDAEQAIKAISRYFSQAPTDA